MRQDKCLGLAQHGSYPKIASLSLNGGLLDLFTFSVSVSTFVLYPLCLHCFGPKERLYLNSSHMIPRPHFLHLHIFCSSCFHHVRLKIPSPGFSEPNYHFCSSLSVSSLACLVGPHTLIISTL